MTVVKVGRTGTSTAIVTVFFVVIIAIGIALYAVYIASGRNTTGTTTPISVGASVAPAPLISFSADAYAIETTSLLNGFSQNAGIPVAPVKSGGSFADAKQIAAGAPDDIFISVALTATGPAYLKNLSSNWAIGFASDQMVLAFSNATSSSSSGRAIIGQANAATQSNATADWNRFFTSLTSGNASVGIADPVADPAGLRGWLALKAAGLLYAGGQNVYASSLLHAKANVTGTNAAGLVAPLESGQIQFLFIYKSAAIIDHLGYISLNRHVNFGDSASGAFYSQISYTDSAGVNTGSPIVLCVTVPLSSANTTEALQFVQYVINHAETLSSYGLQPFSPARLYHNGPPPVPIAQLVSLGLIVEAGSLP